MVKNTNSSSRFASTCICHIRPKYRYSIQGIHQSLTLSNIGESGSGLEFHQQDKTGMLVFLGETKQDFSTVGVWMINSSIFAVNKAYQEREQEIKCRSWDNTTQVPSSVKFIIWSLKNKTTHHFVIWSSNVNRSMSRKREVTDSLSCYLWNRTTSVPKSVPRGWVGEGIIGLRNEVGLYIQGLSPTSYILYGNLVP